jgi:hypothetical protein
MLRARYDVGDDPLRTERRVELGVLVLAALFILQLVYSGARLALSGAPDAVAPAADALRVEAVEATPALAAGYSEEIRARPLFWQSRRPAVEDEFAEAAEPEEVASAELKDVKLQGVFGSGETAGIIALVKGKKQRILQGEKLAGWTLESVSPDRVLLANDGRLMELQLKTAVIKAAEPEKKRAATKPFSTSTRKNGTAPAGRAVDQPAPAIPPGQRRLGRSG